MDLLDGWLDAWIEAGQPYALFWQLTPREIFRVVAAVGRARLQRHDAARVRNHELAQLIGFAFHDPKKMPKYEPTPDRALVKRKVSTEADDARVRAFFINLSKGSQA